MRAFRRSLTGLLVATAIAAPTAHAGWTPVTELRADGVTSGSTVSAAGLDGTAVVAWLRAGNVEAAVKPPGGGFGPVKTLGAGTQPKLAVSDAGDVVVAWDAGDDVAMAERPPGGQFGDATVAVDQTGVDQLAVAFGGTGRLLVAWSAAGTRGLSARAPGASALTAAWAQPIPGATTSLAVGGDGPADAAWVLLTETQGTTTRVLARRWTPTGAAPVVTLRDVANVSAAFPNPSTTYASSSAVIAGHDRASLIWRDDTLSSSIVSSIAEQISEATSTDGTLGPATPIVTGGSTSFVGSSSLTAAAVDAGPDHVVAGYLYVSATTLPAVTTTYYVGGLRRDGAAFDAATNVATSSTSALSPPGVAALPDKRGLFVYGDGPVLDAVVRTAGGAPGPTQLVAGDPGSATSGLTATGDGGGGALAAWTLAGPPSSAKVALYDETPPVVEPLAGPATGVAGAPLKFGAPGDHWSPTTYAWTTGDGSSATGQSITHTFAAAGTYTVTVSATDAGGNSATATRQVTIAAAPSADAVPVISDARLSRSRFAVAAAKAAGRKPKRVRGAKLTYRLSKAATVTAAITRTAGGWRSGTRCAARRPKTGRPRRCTRTLRVGSLRLPGAAGANSAAFTGRLGGKALKPAAYGLTLTAKDAAGQAAKPVALRFAIVR